MHSMLKRSLVPLMGLVLMFSVPGGLLAGQEAVQDGVLHVTNGAEPRNGVETMDFEEVWRVGGEDSEDFFGLISQVIADKDGKVYLLDTRLSEVLVYSPSGERLGTLSREGDGPGETRTPTNLLQMPDGSLGLVQMFPGKVTKIDTEGGPQGEFKVAADDPTAGGFIVFYDCLNGGDRLILTAESITQNPPTGQIRTNFVAAFDQEGHELARFVETGIEMDFTKFVFDEDNMGRVDFRKVCVGPDGRVYIAADRNAYAIRVFQPDGTPDRVIEREYTHLKRSDEDYNAVKTSVETQLAQLPNSVIKISHTEPDIGSVRFGPDSNLWVTTSRSGKDQPEGVLATYDVFDPDGDFLKQVAVKCEGNGEEDALFFSPGGDAILVTGFTSAVRSLQRGGAGGADEDEEEAEPMEVVYLKRK